MALLLGRRYNRAKKAQFSRPGNDNAAKREDQIDPRDSVSTAEKLAAEHGVSPATVKRAGQYAAAVEPLQGREYLAAMQTTSETTMRVRLRYRPGVKPTMRVKHGAKLYGIQSVIDIKSTGRELVLMCKASG